MIGRTFSIFGVALAKVLRAVEIGEEKSGCNIEFWAGEQISVGLGESRRLPGAQTVAPLAAHWISRRSQPQIARLGQEAFQVGDASRAVYVVMFFLAHGLIMTKLLNAV
jgi:hypothetical protein